MIEVQLSRAAALNLVLTLLLVLFSFIWEETQLRTLVVGAFGAAAMYALLRERKPEVAPAKPIPGLQSAPEPPPATDPLKQSPLAELDWDEMARSLTALNDHDRQMTLQILRRVYAAAVDNGGLQSGSGEAKRLERVVWTVEQECQRLIQAAQQVNREHSDDDMLTKASEVVDWALQKAPEITELNISDLLMAKAVADINHHQVGVNNIVVNLSELKAIHNVDRDTAIDKSRRRALAARRSLAAIENNGLVLSEALISSHGDLEPFESITGMQVVSLGSEKGYVTFEGNGRAWALKQAFSRDVGIKVEVRLFEFPTSSIHEDIIRRVERVRKWKNVTDEWPALV